MQKGEVPEDTRSNTDEGGCEPGRVGPGRLAQPIPGSIRPPPFDLDDPQTIYSPPAKSHTSIHSSSAAEE
jgi:hypothetical protein